MRKTDEFMTSGEFAKLCKTSKVTLRHYKDIGLLIPEQEGENGYQYYEPEQFYDYYLIHILKRTGMPLSVIKSYMSHPKPQSILELLKMQQAHLADEKQEIEQMEQVIAHGIASIELGCSARFSSDKPAIEYLEEEHLIAIPVSELREATEETALISLLHKYVSICQQENLATDYQTGAIFPAGDVLNGTQTASHIYTKIDQPCENQYYQKKPAGYYLTILDKGHWDTAGSYKLLADYIRENHLKAAETVYAYDLAGYLLNGIEENTMSLIMVPIELPMSVLTSLPAS